jgi:hypothetical protein
MNSITRILIASAFALISAYSIIGTASRVEHIKDVAPSEIQKRGWRIVRYEGFQYGSWSYHGGKVWYHVADTANSSIQYRVFITMWNDELQYYYKQPETLQRVEIDYSK